MREDIRNIILVLGHSRAEDINCPYSKDDGRTALHIAAALGNVVYVQLLLWVSSAPYYRSAPILKIGGLKYFRPYVLWYACNFFEQEKKVFGFLSIKKSRQALQLGFTITGYILIDVWVNYWYFIILSKSSNENFSFL